MTNLIEKMARAIRESVALFDCGECGTRGGEAHAWDCKQTWRDDARSALTAIEAAGYRVVPVEPTEEMVAAFCGSEGCVSAGAVWGAMLAAAPKVTP